ncbi:MAG: hypothetical protein ACFFDT_35870 [Candidatus Hodarchaeota archaeon]
MKVKWVVLFLVLSILSSSGFDYIPSIAGNPMQEWETMGTFFLNTKYSNTQTYRMLDYAYQAGFKESSFFMEVTVFANSSSGVLVSPVSPIFEPYKPILINPKEIRNQTYTQVTKEEGGDYASYPFEIFLQLANITISGSNTSGQYYLKLLDPGITFPAPGFLERFVGYEIFEGLLVLVCLWIWKHKRKHRQLK